MRARHRPLIELLPAAEAALEDFQVARSCRLGRRSRGHAADDNAPVRALSGCGATSSATTRWR